MQHFLQAHQRATCKERLFHSIRCFSPCGLGPTMRRTILCTMASSLDRNSSLHNQPPTPASEHGPNEKLPRFPAVALRKPSRGEVHCVAAESAPAGSHAGTDFGVSPCGGAEAKDIKIVLGLQTVPCHRDYRWLVQAPLPGESPL